MCSWQNACCQTEDTPNLQPSRKNMKIRNQEFLGSPFLVKAGDCDSRWIGRITYEPNNQAVWWQWEGYRLMAQWHVRQNADRGEFPTNFPTSCHPKEHKNLMWCFSNSWGYPQFSSIFCWWIVHEIKKHQSTESVASLGCFFHVKKPPDLMNFGHWGSNWWNSPTWISLLTMDTASPPFFCGGTSLFLFENVNLDEIRTYEPQRLVWFIFP